MAYSNIFVRFYDSIMGDRVIWAKTVESLILENCSKAKNILELACGTGSVLQYFDKRGFKLHGLDISKEMIAEARKKVPNAALSVQDMRNFKLDEKFDIILCLFDSMNHLLSMKDWEMVFDASFKHLKDSGVFIFDMNTKHKLSTLAKSPPISRKFGDNTFSSQVLEKSDGIYDWNITITEKQKGGSYKNHKEVVQETSFPLSIIEKLAKKRFREIKFVDQNGCVASEQSKRVYFICSK